MVRQPVNSASRHSINAVLPDLIISSTQSAALARPIQEIEHQGRLKFSHPADSLSRFQAETTGKDPQPAKERLFLGGQQSITPGNCPPQRLMAGIWVAPAAQEPEIFEAGPGRIGA